MINSSANRMKPGIIMSVSRSKKGSCMLQKLLPRQENFFILFQEVADELQKTSNQFQQMLNDLPHQAQYAKTIEGHKQNADKLTRTMFETLHKTFITPFDRHDIHQLTNDFSNLFDLINRVSQRMGIYRLESVPLEICSLGALCACAASLVKSAIFHIDSLQNSAKIFKSCSEIAQIEVEADKILLTGIGWLFQEVSDFKQLLAIKEIYEYLELIINKFQSLANTIECIVLEYS